MADVVTVDNGGLTDYSVATDDVTIASGPAGQVQYVKLADGTPNGTQGIGGELGGLWVVTHRDEFPITVTSSGLTTATTAYTNGDQLGAQMTFANAARVSGGSGIITGVFIVSAADITGPIDLQLAAETITLAGDNAAYAISDADSIKLKIPLIQCAGAFDIGNNRLAQAYNIAVPYACVGTSLFGGLITRTGHTFFGAATDLQVTLTVERN